MSAPGSPSPWLPRTMAARLSLVLFGGLLVAHVLSFGLLFFERFEAASSMLMTNVEHDVGVAVNMLDRLPPAERASALPVLHRRTVRYLLDAGETQGPPPRSPLAREMTGRIARALGPGRPIVANALSDDPEQFQIHLSLSDGTPLTIDVQPSLMPVARWLPYVLAAQLVLLLACTWYAVRLATRPLEQLAAAARTLPPSGDGDRLAASGPVEVAEAVGAFNAMQDRIAAYGRERLQILAAISHDLQTPITRLRLRAEAMDASPERDSVIDDLIHMQHLVREGIAYARSSHAAAEPMLRVDLEAFLDSLVTDYQDVGKPVTLAGRCKVQVATRPHALRRVLANLIDNALAYAGAAEVDSASLESGEVRVVVRDRGSGIPDSELDKVMEPFYRLEASRNRDTGGTGLGLAIAHQLAGSIGARLVLRNREGGGLEAILALPAAAKGRPAT
jgi:signal transduction histidine kinase